MSPAVWTHVSHSDNGAFGLLNVWSYGLATHETTSSGPANIQIVERSAENDL